MHEAPRHVAYLYLDHIHSALRDNPLYFNDTKLEKWVKYGFQVAKLPRVFGSLLDSVTALLGIIKLVSQTRAIVKLEEVENVS